MIIPLIIYFFKTFYNMSILYCSRGANYLTQILLRPGASDLTGSFRSVIGDERSRYCLVNANLVALFKLPMKRIDQISCTTYHGRVDQKVSRYFCPMKISYVKFEFLCTIDYTKKRFYRSWSTPVFPKDMCSRWR